MNKIKETDRQMKERQEKRETRLNKWKKKEEGSGRMDGLILEVTKNILSLIS